MLEFLIDFQIGSSPDHWTTPMVVKRYTVIEAIEFATELAEKRNRLGQDYREARVSRIEKVIYCVH